MKLVDEGNKATLTAGTFPGVVGQVIDAGTQAGKSFSPDEPARPRPQVIVIYEVETDDGNATVSKRYTASLNTKATLRKHAEALMGPLGEPAKLDLADLLGKGCLVALVTNERGYVDVNGVMAMPKGMKAPAPSKPPRVFDITSQGCPIPSDLPAWVIRTIQQSPEWSGVPLVLPDATGANPAPAPNPVKPSHERRFDNLLT